MARLKHLLSTIAQMTPLPLPPSLAADVRRLVRALAEPEQAALLSDVRMVGDGFWVLLMVLSAVALAPLAMTRAHPNFAVGTLAMLATAFMGVQITTGPLMAVSGQELFWRDVSACFARGALPRAVVSAFFLGCSTAPGFAPLAHWYVRASDARMPRWTAGGGGVDGSAASVRCLRSHQRPAGLRPVVPRPGAPANGGGAAGRRPPGVQVGGARRRNQLAARRAALAPEGRVAA
jgi:hypothetical protein